MIGIYLRVSSDKQDEEMQINAIKRILTEEEFKNSKIFKDHGISGSTNERPEYQNLLMDSISGKIDRIVCYEWSRLWRDLEEQNRVFKLLQTYNIILQSAMEGTLNTIDDVLKANIIGSINQHERARLIRRTNEGIDRKKQKIKEGKDIWKGRGKDKKPRKLRGDPNIPHKCKKKE